jgi:hypothetical protein
MLGDFDPQYLLAMAELAQLRTLALDLFDRCLAEGNTAPIIAFVERQLASDPPHLQLLREFAEDLQLRLLSLRSYHYDVRNNVVRTFEGYGVDITSLAPPNALERYHQIDAKQVIAYAIEHSAALSTQDTLLLGKLLEASIKTAARLSSDIRLTTELQNMVLDWFDALSSTVGRRFWSEKPPPKPAIH